MSVLRVELALPEQRDALLGQVGLEGVQCFAGLDRERKVPEPHSLAMMGPMPMLVGHRAQHTTASLPFVRRT